MPQAFRAESYSDYVGPGVIGANSEALATADAVLVNSSGFLAICSTSSRILGFSVHDETMGSANQTAGNPTKPLFVIATPLVLVEYGGNADFTQGDVGDTTDFSTASTGAFVVNATTTVASSSGTGGGHLYIHAFDPDGIADNDSCVVSVAEPAYLSFAQV